MSEHRDGEDETMESVNALVPSRRDAGFWKEFWHQVRLVWYLFRDPEVPAYLKLLPVAAVLYAISPVDFIPDVLIGLGQLDDLTILLLGGKVFIEMAPPDVVARYLNAMRQASTTAEIDELEEKAKGGDIIDAIVLNPDRED
jgi:uncharacterized membrane protein YkvA (DUF1232 family)